MTKNDAAAPAFHALGFRALRGLLQRTPLDQGQVDFTLAVASVLPFRVNAYILEDLIDWAKAPDDPIFRLTFPQPDMLPAEDLAPIVEEIRRGSPENTRPLAEKIRRRLNPHPAGQTDLNVPELDGQTLPGLQHKYRETVLFFPRNGQTCHAYCTYCFRWAQFVGEPDLKIAGESEQLRSYLLAHNEVTDVLLTGGDPMIMSTQSLARYVKLLLAPELSHVRTIRIGTKALSYWPHRFTTSPDSDELMRLFEEISASGKHLALMAHVSHPRELSTTEAQRAMSRITQTGTVIRTQAPLIRTVNDEPGTWRDIWTLSVKYGAVPYYMFIERDTGPRQYFQVPLVRAWEIYRDAYSSVGGLARTVRGPSMSATPGKVCVDGLAEIGGRRLFVLHYIQARDPSWVGRPFFANYDPRACWLTDLTSPGPICGNFTGGLKHAPS
jgi:KamA family protein